MSRSLNRLVIVDDNRIDLMMGRRSFDRAVPGVSIAECHGSEDAVDQILHPETELVLLDINMPGFDGFDVLNQARTKSKTMYPPVIMLTSSADPRDVDRAFSVGASAYVVKPRSTEEYNALATGIAQVWAFAAKRADSR